MGSQVVLQDRVIGLWDRHVVVTDVGQHRRYFVRQSCDRVAYSRILLHESAQVAVRP